jgi:hypothetical protein
LIGLIGLFGLIGLIGSIGPIGSIGSIRLMNRAFETNRVFAQPIQPIKQKSPTS